MTPTPSIPPTRPLHVVTSALLGFAVAFAALWWWQGSGESLPIPGWASWASVALIAGGIAWLSRDRKPREPQQSVNRALLGKTSMVAGAFLGAAYLALVALTLPGLPAPLAQERLIHGVLAVVACVLWVVAGWFLQRACLIPPDEDEPSSE